MNNRYRLELNNVTVDGTEIIDIAVTIWDMEADNRTVNLKRLETLLNNQDDHIKELMYKFKEE